ncbi:hypothetical protein V492_01129 [Pseudogymnoascus sp. VKM F-4246]|nr:hypothetical protein V492_01129 [Pseudogymnoascus sp. VKM F-4246]
MSARSSTVPPTPPPSKAAETQDGFGQLIQHNSSFHHHSNSFRGGSQMSPDGSPVPGLDDNLYGNGVYQYGNGQDIFQNGLSPNIGIGPGYGDLQYGEAKQEPTRYAPVPDDPQLYGYGSHEPSPVPSAMSPPLNVRRTRSGQAINRAIQQLKPPPKQTPRASSPKPKTKKVKKEKIKSENRLSKLDQPLSELTREWTHVPVVDIDAYVNRSTEIRRQEVEEGKNPGKVKRPMNSFMLYRKAYQNRTKSWCLQNNHQVVSQVCGDSWPLEPDSVRAQFNEWARIERQNHQNAHPGYKFSPAKAGTAKAAKRKASVSDEESGLEDFDWEGGRGTRAVKRQRLTPKPSHTPPAQFQTQPYYGFDLDSRGSSIEPGMGGSFHSSTYHASNPGRNVPEPYRPNIPDGQYWQQEVVPNMRNPNIHDVILRRTRGPGTNVAPPPPVYQQEYYHHGVMNGGIAQNPYNGYQDEPEAKIDPSLMGHDQLYDDAYAADENEVFLDNNGLMFDPQYFQQPLGMVDEGQQSLQQHLAIVDGNQQPPQPSLEITDGVKQEYPEYPGSQSGVPETPILNQHLDDPNNQDIWRVVGSLETGDEFNNKWMGAESGQED